MIDGSIPAGILEAATAVCERTAGLELVTGLGNRTRLDRSSWTAASPKGS